MKQQIPKPENWQDFESLCKKLWKEIWNCPEIKKNGRSGQNQYGVDVYGIPDYDNRYYGIQCKGKDDYTHSKLTTSEVDQEILKAKKFTPQLKKFYFATTANKDVVIESYVREKNLESIELGLFEVHLFSWEDIVDLIEENKETYNWYVRKLDFKTRYAISFTFENGEAEIEANPEFDRYDITYRDNSILKTFGIDKINKTIDSNLSLVNPLYRNYLKKQLDEEGLEIKDDSSEQFLDPQPVKHLGLMIPYNTHRKRLNLSCCRFKLKLSNIGSEIIDNYKIYIKLNGVINADTVDKQKEFFDLFKYKYDTVFSSSDSAVIRPSENQLVQNDWIVFDEICFKPISEKHRLHLTWNLVARDFTTDGELYISVNPLLHESAFPMFVDNPQTYKSRKVIKTVYKFA